MLNRIVYPSWEPFDDPVSLLHARSKAISNVEGLKAVYGMWQTLPFCQSLKGQKHKEAATEDFAALLYISLGSFISFHIGL